MSSHDHTLILCWRKRHKFSELLPTIATDTRRPHASRAPDVRRYCYFCLIYLLSAFFCHAEREQWDDSLKSVYEQTVKSVYEQTVELGLRPDRRLMFQILKGCHMRSFSIRDLRTATATCVSRLRCASRLILFSCLIATVAPSSSADAARPNRTIIGYVTARSEFGNGKVRGAVRRARNGRQVQLPGGTWVYCQYSCQDTLRLKTVDFWESEEGAGPRNAITAERGLFYPWLHWEFGY